MSYLLDTNACIAVLNGSPESVRAHLNRALALRFQVFVPSIVSVELWCGVGKSARQQVNTGRLSDFFSGNIHILPFEDDDARVAGFLRANLEALGKPIGPYDLLIAAQAIRHKLTLVTANVSEFSRVKSLKHQDWAKR